MVLELANEEFARSLDSPVRSSPERHSFVCIGQSRDGLDLRIAYFRGARLTRGRSA